MSQNFETKSVANDRFALYTLSIRNAAPPHAPVLTYTFPISPSSLARSFTAMTNIFDVQGQPIQQGVNRIVDQYGNSPVTFKMSGTTGWKLHSMDNFQKTGIASVIQVKDLLESFAKYNQDQISRNAKSLYLLEFYDYFLDEYWEVVPVGVQTLRQSEDKALFVYYDFSFVGIKPVGNPTQSNTPGTIEKSLTNTPSSATATTNHMANSNIINYALYSATGTSPSTGTGVINYTSTSGAVP